jgi:glycosyltransferase involved in cell wall biosynthesis
VSDAPTVNVSFVVIAYNEESSIGATLASILEQEAACNSEIVVVDDGSSDGTAAVVDGIARDHSAVRLVCLEKNRGRGFARATGVGEATGDLIAMVDGDIVLPPDWLARCLESIKDAEAVAGTAVPDGDVAYVSSRFGLQPRSVAHSTTVTGSNAVYRREIFDHVSFDSGLRNGEDIALNHALKSLGVRLLTVPGLIVCHEENKTLQEALAWMFESGRGAARQLYRYRTVRVPDLVFGGWLLTLIGGIECERRSRRIGRWLPVVYTGAAAGVHIARAFKCEQPQGHRFAGAVLADAGLLSSYFVGRLVGSVVPA